MRHQTYYGCPNWTTAGCGCMELFEHGAYPVERRSGKDRRAPRPEWGPRKEPVIRDDGPSNKLLNEVATALQTATKGIPPEFAQIVDREFWNLLNGSDMNRESPNG